MQNHRITNISLPDFNVAWGQVREVLSSGLNRAYTQWLCWFIGILYASLSFLVVHVRWRQVSAVSAARRRRHQCCGALTWAISRRPTRWHKDAQKVQKVLYLTYKQTRLTLGFVELSSSPCLLAASKCRLCGAPTPPSMLRRFDVGYIAARYKLT